MVIEGIGYSKEEFRNAIKKRPWTLFENYKKRRWLKIYAILVEDNWQRTLFAEGELQRIGEIYKASLLDAKSEDREIYYLEEYSEGLILLYTYASNERYQSDLGYRIEKRLGATRMWIKPNLFRLFYQGILDESDGYIHLFSGNRECIKDMPCDTRPNYQRRIEYRGDERVRASGFDLAPFNRSLS